MRIVCPSCDAAYDVPASVVAARRTVRCAQCGADFPALATVETDGSGSGADEPPPAETTSQAPPAAPPPLPQSFPAPQLRVAQNERLVSPSPKPRATRKRVAAVLATWALSFGLLAAAGWAVVTWRDRIVQVWPPSTRLYAALGYKR